MSIERMLADIPRNHFPNSPATPEEIEAFERQAGWRLDPELRAFYLRCNGAELFQRPNSPCRLRPLSRIQRARLDMRGEDSDEWGPATWYVIADLPESDCVLIDVGAPVDGHYPVIDGFHEADLVPEECKRIAGSFSEFLEQLLRHNERKFWLGPPDS